MNGPTQGQDRYTTTTNDSSPASLQSELDLLDTINATNVVLEGFTKGYHNDVEAVRICGRAVRRKAHHALVARINRGDA